MIISPKARNRPSFLDLNETNVSQQNKCCAVHTPRISFQRNSISDFKSLKIIGKESSVHTIVARRQSEAGLYAIKTVQKSMSSANLLKHVRSEQACLRMITEDSDSCFLPKLHKSFQDETRLYMVFVRLAIT